MKRCMGTCSIFSECKGEIKRYDIHSPKENTTYPERFWGVSDYCDIAASDDIKRGFILTESDSVTTYVL
jgi:hypothetical protein